MPDLELPDDIDAIARALPVVPHGLDELRWLLASLPPLSPNSLPGTMPAELPPSDGTAASSGSGATGPAAGTLTAPFADNTGTSLLPGSLPLTPFASSIRPVVLVTTLPTLPSGKYPEGAFVYKTSDVPPRLYKNVADAWVAAIGANDIEANSITAGQIAAGAINTDELAANAVTTAKLATGQITLYDSTGAVALSPAGFGGVWQRFLATGFFNGDFYAPSSPGLGSELNNSTNPLPWWSYTRVAGTACTAATQIATDSASGFKLRFSLSGTGGGASDECYVEQIIPISGSRGQSFAYHLAVTFNPTAYTAGNAQVYLSVQHLKKDGVTTTGSLTTYSGLLSGYTAGTVNDLSSYGSSFTSPPADAYFARVRVGLKRNTATTTQTATVDVFEVRVSRMPQIIGVADSGGTVTPGTIDKSGELLRIKPSGKNGGGLYLDGNAAGLSYMLLPDNGFDFTGDTGSLRVADDGSITEYRGNTFDTYTPTIGGDGSPSYTTRTGWYMKIGKMVFVNIYVIWSTAGSGTAAVTITTPSNPDRSTRQVLVGTLAAASAGNGVVTLTSYTSGSGAVWDNLRDSTGSAVTGTDMEIGTYLWIQGWYREA